MRRAATIQTFRQRGVAINAKHDQSDESRPKPDPYDLADEQDESAASSPADAPPPRRKLKPDADTKAAAPIPPAADDAEAGDADAGAYELADAPEDEPRATLDELAADPRAAGAVDDDAPADGGPGAATEPPPAEAAGAPERPRPTIHSTEEPKYVDPAVAARRRDEARARAAEQALLDAQAASRRRNIIIGIVAGIAAILLVIYLFRG